MVCCWQAIGSERININKRNVTTAWFLFILKVDRCFYVIIVLLFGLQYQPFLSFCSVLGSLSTSAVTSHNSKTAESLPISSLVSVFNLSL